MIADQVALILTASDRSGTAINSFVRNMTSAQRAQDRLRAAADAAAKSNGKRVVDQEAVARGETVVTDATLKQTEAAEASALAAKSLAINKAAVSQATKDERAQTQALTAARTLLTKAEREAAASTRAITAAQREAAAADLAAASAADKVAVARGRRTLLRGTLEVGTPGKAGYQPAVPGLVQQQIGIVNTARVNADTAQRRYEQLLPTLGPKLSNGKYASSADQIALQAAYARTQATLQTVLDQEAKLAKLRAEEANIDAVVTKRESEHTAALTTTAQRQAAIVEAENNRILAAGRVTDALTAETAAQTALNDQTVLVAGITADATKANEAYAASQVAAADAVKLRKDAEAALKVTKAGSMVPIVPPTGPGMMATLGPMAAATAAAGIALVGVHASKLALAFDAAEHQIAAQTDNITPQKFKQIQQAGNIALDFTSGGTSQFDPTTVLQGALVPIAHGLQPAVVKQLLPLLAQQAGILKTPNLDIPVAALISMSGYKGNISKTTAAQGKALIDMVTAADQRTPAPPATLSAALPKLFASTRNSGVSAAQALGAEVQLVRTTGATPSVVAGWFGQLVRSTILKPTPAATKLATSLGLDMGSKGLAEAGGNPFVYWSNLFQGVGGDTNKFGKLLGASPAEIKAQMGLTPAQLSAQMVSGGGGGSGINALRAFLGLNASGAMEGAAGLTDVFSKSGGVTSNAQKELLLGQQQQLTGLMNRLNGDLTKVGLTINKYVLPALIDLASGALSATEGIVTKFGDFGDWLSHHGTSGASLVKGALVANPVTGPLATLKLLSDYFSSSAASAVRPAEGSIDVNRKASGYAVNGIRANTQDAMLGNEYASILATHDKALLASFLKQTGFVPTATVPRAMQAAAPPGLYDATLHRYANTPEAVSSYGTHINEQAPTAYASNLFATPAERKNQQQVLETYAQSASALKEYQQELVDFNKAVTDGASNTTLEKLRDKLIGLINSPALIAAFGGTAKLEAAQTKIASTVGRLELKRSPVLQDFKNSAVEFGRADTANNLPAMIELRDWMVKLTKNPHLLAAANLNNKSGESYIQQKLSYANDAITAKENSRALDAANKQYTAAELFYRGVVLHHGTLDQLNKASTTIYNKQIAVAKAANKKNPNQQVYQDAVLSADEQYANAQQTNIGTVMPAAQDSLTLAENSGKGIKAAADKIRHLLALQYKGNEKNDSYKLALQQLDTGIASAQLPEAQDALTLAEQANTGGVPKAAKVLKAILAKQYKGKEGSASYILALQQIDTGIANALQPEADAQLAYAESTGTGLAAALANSKKLLAQQYKGKTNTYQYKQALNQLDLGAITAQQPEADAGLTLAEQSGKGIEAAAAKVRALLAQQYKGKEGSNQYKLDLANLDIGVSQSLQPEAQAQLTLAEQTGVRVPKAANALKALLAKQYKANSAQFKLAMQQIDDGITSALMPEANAKLALAESSGKGIPQAAAAVQKLLLAQYHGDKNNAQYRLAVQQLFDGVNQQAQQEVQAQLTLAQDTGKGLPQALAAMRASIDKQYAANPDSYQKKLALYNLDQEAKGPVLPGPRLIRPNVAGVGALDATFTGSISQLSTPKESSANRIIAALEQQVVHDREVIAALRAGNTVNSEVRTAVRSIDAKTPPGHANKGKRGTAAENLGNLRIPA